MKQEKETIKSQDVINKINRLIDSGELIKLTSDKSGIQEKYLIGEITVSIRLSEFINGINISMFEKDLSNVDSDISDVSIYSHVIKKYRIQQEIILREEFLKIKNYLES